MAELRSRPLVSDYILVSRVTARNEGFWVRPCDCAPDGPSIFEGRGEEPNGDHWFGRTGDVTVGRRSVLSA
jgi:hypothetical protein